MASTIHVCKLCMELRKMIFKADILFIFATTLENKILSEPKADIM